MPHRSVWHYASPSILHSPQIVAPPHIAASALRDGIEDMAGGAVDEGEELSVEVISGSELKLRLTSSEEVRELMVGNLIDAAEDALRGLGTDISNNASIGRFTMVSQPSSAFRR
jgi:hypothetical protein